eukprot:491287_1
MFNRLRLVRSPCLGCASLFIIFTLSLWTVFMRQKTSYISSRRCIHISWHRKTKRIPQASCLLKWNRDCVEPFDPSMQALFLYNGFNLWDPRNKNDVYLANDSYLIAMFAVILAFNCFGSGLCWLSYALMTRCCHGLVFKLSLFCVDQISDLFYALFPFMIVLLDDYNDDKWNVRVLLAQLNAYSTALAFISSFVPLLFLSIKSVSIITSAQIELADKYYLHWKLVHDIAEQKDAAQAIYMSQLSGWSVDVTSLRKEIFDAKGNLALTMTRAKTRSNWIESKGKGKVSRKKQTILIALALCYVIYGVGVLSYVMRHLNQAQRYCASVQETNYYEDGQLQTNRTVLNREQRALLQSNPELFFFDKCLYKVYPFVDNHHHPCQCRVFVIDWHDTVSTAEERHSYFNLTQPVILTHMLQHWVQLEKFRTNKKEQTLSRDGMKLTKSMFVAKHMKAFEWTFADISCIERGISEWKKK